MTVEWFTESNRIVETAWGRFQDTPIFRYLAREHNIVADFKDRKRPNEERTQGYEEWLESAQEKMNALLHEERDAAFRKALLIQAIADGGYDVESN